MLEWPGGGGVHPDREAQPQPQSIQLRHKHTCCRRWTHGLGREAAGLDSATWRVCILTGRGYSNPTAQQVVCTALGRALVISIC